jgi:opacity protein-like surface antigen
MFTSRLALSSLALLATLGVARAADMPMPPPPAPVEQFGGWYLRGQVGVGMSGTPDLEYQPAPANVGNGFVFDTNSMADSVFIGGGVGYEWNSWLRFDVTGEYRSRARVYAYGHYPPNGLDTYEGYVRSWVFLANGYVDLGTWNCFTPFIGAGIGGAYVNLADFSDVNPNGGHGVGRNPYKWNLAWALHAGVDYQVSKNLKVELAYRYLNYGSITDTVDCAGGCNPDSYKFGNLYSHDIMLGLRWNCCDVTPVAQPSYVYAPPPVYTQPPLHSKG